jgi:hypothetical protein
MQHCVDPGESVAYHASSCFRRPAIYCAIHQDAEQLPKPHRARYWRTNQ